MPRKTPFKVKYFSRKPGSEVVFQRAYLLHLRVARRRNPRFFVESLPLGFLHVATSRNRFFCDFDLLPRRLTLLLCKGMK